MKISSRIPTLLFLHSRGETSEAEEKELAVWRGEADENEQLFREVSDPEMVRAMMADMYRKRDESFEKLKDRVPDMTNAKLSNRPDFAVEKEADNEDEEARLDFPEKQILESGLSKAEFWASCLEDLQIEDEETLDNESRVEEPTAVYKISKPRSLKKRRYIRMFWSAAAVIAVVLGVFIFREDSSSGRFKALMIMPNGNNMAVEDFNRGFKLGLAGIRIEKTSNGEPLYVFPDDPRAEKDKTFTLETDRTHEFVLKLPEGTQIWMGAQSSINFPANFSPDTINLKVQGEIYFESGINSSKHFIISTVKNPSSKSRNQQATNKDILIETTGTSLTLSAYPEDSLTRVGIVDGNALVQWEVKSTVQTRQLRAGQQITIPDAKIFDSPQTNKAELVALKNGQFYFKNADLQTILSTVSRWYDVRIQVEGGYPDGKFNIQVPMGTDLSVIVDSLKKQNPGIILEGKTIKILK